MEDLKFDIPNAILKEVVDQMIKDLTPTPGPNYYMHHAHRIKCEKFAAFREQLVAYRETLS